jgi:hypothetical protein
VPELTDIVPQLTPENSSLEFLTGECRAREKTHELNTRFHLLLNLGFAALTTLLLKVDGPYYADAVVAGLFACGLGLSVFSWRSVNATARLLEAIETRRRDEAERLGVHDAPRQIQAVRAGFLFLLLATFFLTAALATVWFSYISVRDQNVSGEDAVATLMTVPRAACSVYGP